MMIGHMYLGTRETELRSAVYMWVLQNLIGSRAIVYVATQCAKKGPFFIFLEKKPTDSYSLHYCLFLSVVSPNRCCLVYIP